MRAYLLPTFLLLACNPTGPDKPLDTASPITDQSDVDGDGFMPASGDCDDNDASINPSATEICDEIDNNCNGTVDEGQGSVFFSDADGDGYGDPNAPITACAQPEGTVLTGTDCDDTVETVHPDAPEACNGVDDNCNGTVDENVTNIWYYDADQDGYGDPNTVFNDCNPPAGYIAVAGDCDDTTSAAAPGVPEICDQIDNNCNGLTDENVSASYYADTDGDGHGNAALSQEACARPAGYVELGDDCNDSEPSVYPGADEYCNGIDDNCDGVIDEDTSLDATLWYSDADGDGYGDASTGIFACTQPAGFVADATDCDDTSLVTYPGADEYCNGIDDNCDGTVDEDSAVDTLPWYADGDQDGYGDGRVSVNACTQPSGFVADNTDCNDGAAMAYPGATEFCDGLDNNCDGVVDEGSAADALTWYADTDSDSFGDVNQPMQACNQPAGYTANALDCDDQNLQIYPGAPEYCNGIDDDCDGSIDENSAVDALIWYADVDGDASGDASQPTHACTQPAGYVSDDNDCNDASSSIHPGASEYCNGIDDDCDGNVDEGAIDASVWYLDADTDGYGNSAIHLSDCVAPAGYVSNASDCNDLNTAVHPSATEFCNNIDDNCDGVVDEPSAVDAATWYVDADTDQFGDASVSQQSCTQPAGYVADDTDCDDGDAAIYPGAPDHWYDGVDSNCDGVDDPSVCDEVPGDTTVAYDNTCAYNYSTSWTLDVEWASADHTYSTGSTYTRIMMQPVVGQLSDDNGDGAIDDLDNPDIAYTTFSGSAYSSAGYLRVVSGDGSGEILSVATVTYGGHSYAVASSGGVAIGDIDGDGHPEIVTITITGQPIVLNEDGTVQWASQTGTGSAYSVPYLADMNGDGASEVIVGGYIFSSTGTVLVTTPTGCNSFGNIAADMDLDGDLELVCGGAVYNLDGTRVWLGSNYGGYPGVGNFDADPYPEVAVVSSGYFYLYDNNGTLLWSYNTGDSGGGPPLVADVDGDGSPEIGAGFQSYYTVMETNGSRKWRMAIQDSSSRSAGSAAFDLDGDGDAEVVYADERDMWIFDGVTGSALIRETNHSSGTLREYPVIADVDRDGNAEIVLASNNYAFAGWDGLRIIGEANDQWASARSIWNQYNFHVTNINEDDSIPLYPDPWWDDALFHSNTSWSAQADGAPNLGVRLLGVCSDCSTTTSDVYVSVENTGAVFTGTDIPVSLYAVNGATTTLLATQNVGREVYPGDLLAPIIFTITTSSIGLDGLRVVVDDDGTGAGTQNECDESDNSDTWNEGICN